MTTIDAGTAKLAGLQIDLLTKFRAGQMTLEHIEWFNGLSRTQRDMLSGADLTKLKQELPAEPTVKFALLVDLGIITVPDNYVHATHLASFKTKHQGGKKSFYGYNNDLTDANFSNPTRILKPGDKLAVRAFKQIVPGTTTSEERMTFLATQNAVHTGAQGASLVFEQKRDQLPKGKWYASFDEKDRLWEDSDGHRRVPYVFAYSDVGFNFALGYFEDVWCDVGAFFCFCDLPAGEAHLGA